MGYLNMSDERIELILKELNNLDELLWLLRSKACSHRDAELLTVVGSLNSKIDDIFIHVSELKKK